MIDPNVNNWYPGGRPPWGIVVVLIGVIALIIWVASGGGTP
jgi:hypothetical protein